VAGDEGVRGGMRGTRGRRYAGQRSAGPGGDAGAEAAAHGPPLGCTCAAVRALLHVRCCTCTAALALLQVRGCTCAAARARLRVRWALRGRYGQEARLGRPARPKRPRGKRGVPHEM
jgi:hypothetical protein